MIDDKKIKEAAMQHSRWLNSNHEESTASDSFMEGAKWMQEEFLKNLWHPASEEPDVRHKTIICLYEDGHICQDYDVSDEATRHDRILGIGEFNWDYYAEDNEIKKWCYDTDILPKEGGEHNERA